MNKFDPSLIRPAHRYQALMAIIAFLFLVVLPLVSRQPVQAAQEQTYDGLDIVFLIDQSDSMQRINTGGAPNDPLFLRFYSLWYSMYWLGEDRLLVHNDIDFRIAVVNFGSRVETWEWADGRRWQTIAPASRSAWEPVYEELTDQIQVEMQGTYTEESLGATDFLQPFAKARELFNELPVGENRRRVIILLTDGQPSGLIGGPFVNVPAHMTELRVQAAESFPDPNYLIYVVAMIDAGGVYWDDIEADWEALTHDTCTAFNCPDPEQDRASIVSSNDDVGRRFQQILQSLTGDFPVPENLVVVDSAVIPGPLVVPPYLKSLNFTYFKSNPDERLILTDPNGVQATIGQPRVTMEGAGGPIEALRIANPVPGRWYVATDPPQTDVDITMRQIYAQSRLDSPVRPQVQFLPTTVQYGLLDDVGQPLPFYADRLYRLLVNATISRDGYSWPIQLTEQAGNVYQATFTPVLTGTHAINVHAESQDLNGNPITVFDGQIGTFDVEPVVLVALETPSTMQQYDSGNFSFELQDSRGFPVTSTLPISLTVTVSGEPGQPLNVAPGSDGVYRISYSPQQPGQHTAQAVAIVSDAEGQPFDIANLDLGAFSVLDTVFVGLSIVEPTEAIQNATELWPPDPTTVTVMVEVRDENGQLVDPTDVFADPAQALRLNLTNDGGDDLSDELVLQPTGEQGVYRAQSAALGRGNYTIKVNAIDDLRAGYLYTPNGRSDTFNLSRIRHPLHLPIIGGTVGVLLLLTLIAVGLLVRKRRITAHPVMGRIVIVDSASVPQWQGTLDGRKRNHIVLKDFPPITRVKKIEANCTNEADSKARRFQLKLWQVDDRQPTIDSSAGPEFDTRIGNTNFWVLKDPTDEQLSRNRHRDVAAGPAAPWTRPESRG